MKTVSKKNITEIAKLAEVSVTTVSRVLNNSNLVKPETREKVMKVIREYNYIPSETARFLSKRDSRVIGVVFPDLRNPFFYGLLEGITNVADAYDYNVLMFYTDENPDKERKILQVAKGKDLAGIIITPAGIYEQDTADILESYEEEGRPVVLLDRVLDGRVFTSVLADNEAGSYEAVRQLIWEGHQKIALIAGNANISPVQERMIGYYRALTEAGIQVRQEYIIHGNSKSGPAYEGMKALMELKDPPTAAFTTNNMCTLGVLKCLTEKHLKIGEDVSLIGFDDIEDLRIIDYNLSVVERSPVEMGEQAMKKLLCRIKGEEEKSSVEKAKTKLILRGSEKWSKRQRPFDIDSQPASEEKKGGSYNE